MASVSTFARSRGAATRGEHVELEHASLDRSDDAAGTEAHCTAGRAAAIRNERPAATR